MDGRPDSAGAPSGNLATCVTQGDERSAPTEFAQCGLGVPAADRVDHGIDRVGAERAAQPVAQIP